MPTYTIVAQGTSPLGPYQIAAGETIDVSDGDVFILSPGADAHVKFETGSAGPVSFELRIDASNAHDIDLEFLAGLNPEITIASGVDLSDVTIKAGAAASVTLTAGDNVTLGKYDGSTAGVDTLTFGDGFTALEKFKTEGGADRITIGDNATTGEIDTGDGNDRIFIGDNLTATKLVGGARNDVIHLGAGADYDVLDGQAGNDTIGSPEAQPGAQNFETVVCFVRGTRIATERGETPVEDLSVGDLVVTLDRGLQPIRWIGSVTVPGDGPFAPVAVAAGTLGNRRTLRVSPQHRLLLEGWPVALHAGQDQALVAAKHLVNGASVRRAPVASVEYFHMLFDRHEIVFSEGQPSESLHPGDTALRGMGAAARAEILALFPALAGDWQGYGAAARHSLRAIEGRVIARCL